MPPEAIRRIGALLRHNLTLVLQEPAPLIARIGSPMLLMVALEPLYRAALAHEGSAAGRSQAATGMLVMFSLLATSLVGSAVLTERVWRTWDRLRATPARPAELLAGKASAALAVLLAQQLAVITFAHLALGLEVERPALLAAALLVWAMALLGLGAAIATLVRSLGEFGAATDLLSLGLSMLGGALAPIALMPGWLQRVAPISPGYWAMSGLEAAERGDAEAAMRSMLVLLAVAVLAGGVACWRMSRGWERSRLL
ncbi:MAG TPA: ABC transporter permease [Candidatus Dormibacteraeota bacterium]|jgi:ABC-2 type transport system permease protein|nr:ABC transporter permease [Candidatus Dormibacteraeota bacterium]